MTRVYVIMGDQGGCGWFRLGWPGLSLANRGHEIKVFRPGHHPLKATTTRSASGLKIIDVLKPACDVVVFQRPLKSFFPDLFAGLQQHGIKVVVDLDDDFRRVERSHVGWKDVQPEYSRHSNWQHLEHATAIADRVTTSTGALAERYKNQNSNVVIHNHLPRRIYTTDFITPADTAAGNLSVGWAGQVATHPGDLDATSGAVGRLQRRYGFPFKVVGKPQHVRKALHLAREPINVGWQPIERYHETLNAFDIGIAPIASNAFNEAKSWLKPLEYSARCIPFVASNFAEYSALGAGLLASSSETWESHLHQLLTSHETRCETAKAAYQIAQQYVMEDHLELWEKAWFLS